MVKYLFSPNIIEYFLYYIILIVSVFLIGMTFQKNKTRGINIYSSLMLGLFILIVSFAIIYTKANSIFLLCLFLLFYYFYMKLRGNVSDRSNEKDTQYKVIDIVVLLTIFVVVYLSSYYLFYVAKYGYIWADNLYYSNITNSIIKTKIESSIFNNPTKATPYHYGEIWLNVINVKLWGLNAFHSYHLIVIPFLISTLIYGIYNYCLKFIKHRAKALMLSLLLLFYVPCFSLISYFSEYYQSILFFYKLLLPTNILLFSCMLFINNRRLEAKLTLLSIVVFYSTFAPAILFGLYSYILLRNFSKFGFSKKIIIDKRYLYLILFALLYIAFYYFQNNKNIIDTTIQCYKEQPVLFVIKSVIKRGGISIVFLFPILFALYKVNKKQNNVVVLTAVLSSLMASIILAAVATLFIYDGQQIFSNYFSCLFFVIYALSFPYIIKKLSKFLNYILITFLLTIVIINNIYPSKFNYLSKNKNELFINNSEFYTKLQNIILKYPDCKIAYCANQLFLESTDYIALTLYFPLMNLAYICPNGDYQPDCLSIFYIPKDKEYNYDRRTENLLYYFAYNNKLLDLDKEVIIRKFINYKKYDIIIVETGAIIPKCILDIYNKKIEFNGIRIFEKKS